jgi:methylglyoxal synthase
MIFRGNSNVPYPFIFRILIMYMSVQKIGLIAHNAKKEEICNFVQNHRDYLSKFQLIGTEGTARAIREETGLEVVSLDHGPDGGDIRIANKVLDGEIKVLFFFVDLTTPFGHEVDINSLIRICVIKDIPIALNNATAHLIINSLKTN